MSSDLLAVLEKISILPINFSYYETARVHRSYLNESPKGISEHNERLEFLGDAALELAMTHCIFERFPDKEEGWMTDLRSSYVRGTHLAALALKYGLEEIILLSQWERSAGGHRNANILADLFEAIIGALYLDQGFTRVSEFVREYIFASDLVRTEATKDPKSALQELVQKHISLTPSYDVITEEWPDHDKVFTISASILGVTIGTGVGSNKKVAQESAARDALEHQQMWQYLLESKTDI
jgi:ribonuclease III